MRKTCGYEQGNTLVALMEDPILVSAANSFKAIFWEYKEKKNSCIFEIENIFG